MDTAEQTELRASIQKLTKDLLNATHTLSDREARFLVDAYYSMQRDRIRSAHQDRTLSENQEPHDILQWLLVQRDTLEKQIARSLDRYSAGKKAGLWARSIVGIGPIVAAGLIAHIHVGYWCETCHGIDKDDCARRQRNPKLKLPKHGFTQAVACPTVGHVWRFAGLDPTNKWKEGQKRPWNAQLKTLCWKIGESFVKVSNHEDDIYGKIYAQRKQLENERNEAGQFAEQAAASLKAKRYGADTDARKHYEAGRLPPARIHLRSQRVAVKLFLAHLHHVMYEIEFHEPPPMPFILTQPGHVHFLAPPNWPMMK